MNRSPILPAAIFLLVLALSPNAWSQETPAAASETSSETRIGVIAGHTFIPSSFIRDPFIRTYFRTGLGFGSTINFTPPVPTVSGKPILGPTGDLLFALLDAEYQYALRPWLAVRGRLSVVGRMADETPALISQGVTLYYGFDLGWLFRVASTERLSASGSLGVKNASTTDVYLQRFIEGIIDNGAILPGNRLVLQTPTLRGTAGFHGAYALNHLTGVTISGTLDYGESLDRSAPDRWFYSVSVAMDFNMHSDGGTPIGFVVGGRTGSAPDIQATDSRTSQAIFGRIAYTGAEEFALGLDLGYQFLPIRDLPEKQNFLSAVVDIRLYF
jgi:hypothetical protein